MMARNPAIAVAVAAGTVVASVVGRRGRTEAEPVVTADRPDLILFGTSKGWETKRIRKQIKNHNIRQIKRDYDTLYTKALTSCC